ncbi:MAG: AMP-binding protein [Beijerinckiaceae bacterium]|nr:AMP-binding protein [Beijerinckiaceae bacterium]
MAIVAPLLGPPSAYAEVISRFRWQVPALFNIGVACADAHASVQPDRPALIEVGPDFSTGIVSYGQLRDESNRLAQALVRAGIRPGDRVAIHLPQGCHVPIAHCAIYKIGAIAVPLAALFGADALAYRLQDSGARLMITDAAGAAKTRPLLASTPALERVISIDGDDGTTTGLSRFTEGLSGSFEPVRTQADDPALMIYTSGTTGHPKGALHGHRVLLGHLPGVEMHHDFAPQAGDRFWTPADWAWAGGLLNILLPGLCLGIPVVAWPFQKFDPEAAFAMMARLEVRNAFIPPTGLRLMRSVRDPVKRFGMPLRSLGSGGEALGTPTFEWGREVLGLPINEFYGQTECNLVLSSSHAMDVARAGMIGRPVPGHAVDVIREDGTPCAVEEPGQIAIRRPDPVMFLGYWNKPEATDAKFIGDWMTTGDQGYRDGDGYIGFVGRDDDLITSSGYRIGPVEIEDCLIKHPAVALAAVIGKPDPLRTEIVVAFLVLKPGFEASEGLAEEIRLFVRERLSAHEYPREVHFVAEMPLTTTGKIIRRELRQRLS